VTVQVGAVMSWRKLHRWRRLLIIEALNELEDAKQAEWEMQQTMDLQHKRDRQAVARWRAEFPATRDLVHPDLGDLLQWLMDQADTWQNASCVLAFFYGFQQGTRCTTSARSGSPSGNSLANVSSVCCRSSRRAFGTMFAIAR